MIDQALLEDLQFALMEQPDGGQSWPSGIWTRDDVVDAINVGVRQLQRDTHLTVTYLEQLVIPGALSVSMPADWMATAHLVWRTFPEGVRTPLTAVDAYEADLALPEWETTLGSPIGYADLDTNTLELRLVPTPDHAGVLENLYVPVPELMEGNGTEVPVPEEFLSAVKYSALSTLLGSITRLEDAERAAYCDERYAVTQIAADLLLKGGA